MRSKLLHIVIGLLLPGLIYAGDLHYEADMAQQLRNTVKVGQALELDAEGKKFFSLYTETAKPQSQGTVILLHDSGGHPDQKPVIAGLREFLPQHNWTTISLQMPVWQPGVERADYYPLFPEALARIKAAVNYAKSNGSNTIVLAGYGLGALMAVYTTGGENPIGDVSALVTISLPVPETEDSHAQTLAFIKKIKLPMLDVYGEFDSPDVTTSAHKRRLAGKTNKDFQQLLITSEPVDTGGESLLSKRVYSWLARHIDPEAKQKNPRHENQ